MEEEEKYLGGFFSALQLALGALEVGAGIYATTKRLFVVGPLYASGVLRGSKPSLDKIVPGLESELLAPNTLTKEQNADLINEILRHKGVYMEKSRISKLEIKKPPGIFRMGHLEITETSGRTLRIKIGKKREYEKLVLLLKAFDPAVLRVV